MFFCMRLYETYEYYVACCWVLRAGLAPLADVEGSTRAMVLVEIACYQVLRAGLAPVIYYRLLRARLAG